MKYPYLFPLLLFLGACQSSPEEENTWENKILAIEELALRYADLNRFNGTILIEDADSVIYNKSFGLANYEEEIPFSPETEFRIDRLGELLIRDMVESASQEKLIALEDPVQKYLPELEDSLSIQDLLEHRSGYPGQVSLPSHDLQNEMSVVNLANRLKREAPDPKRGSGLDYELVIQVLESVHKKPFGQILSKYVGDLGLHSTHRYNYTKNPARGYLYHNYRGQGMERQLSPKEDQDVYFQNTCLYSSAQDLLTFSKSEEKPLNVFAYTPQDGFNYCLVAVPEKNRTLIILSNYKHPVADEMAESIQRILDEEAYPLPLAREVVKVDPKFLGDYEGTYAMNEAMRFEVVRKSSRLFVHLGGARMELYPQSQNQFFLNDRDASMRFLRDSSGIVNQVELLDGFLQGNVVPRVEALP